MDNDHIQIVEYSDSQELEWLDVHASVMVDSTAWWWVVHRKPMYEKPSVDLVATVDGKIIGFIVIEINSDIVENLNPAGFVWEFGVHRDFRGRNIGFQLIDKAHQQMKDRFDINKSIWYSQKEKACRYYEKIGMKEIDRHWQFSINPGKELHQSMLKRGFNCWSLRGSASIEDFPEVKENFSVVTDDYTLQPRICIGYEYVR